MTANCWTERHVVIYSCGGSMRTIIKPNPDLDNLDCLVIIQQSVENKSAQNRTGWTDGTTIYIDRAEAEQLVQAIISVLDFAKTSVAPAVATLAPPLPLA